MATNYDIDYNDNRFKDVEADKKAALNEVDVTYGSMISQSDQFFDKQIQASKDYADKQIALQNQQTDQTIKEINQQKDQAKKDYTKEQSGAYVDWQKQSSQYGANAEQMAAQGLAGSGYSESSQVSMYNTYQNRVATAREAFVLAKQNYDNAITQAQIANSSALAEIAYNAYQKQLELSLQGFQYKNQLIIEQADKKTEIDRDYYNRYQDVLQQINTENALAEEVRQYNQNYNLQVKQLDEQIRQFEQEYSLKVKEYKEGIRQFNEEIARLKAKDAQEYKLEIKNLELKKKQLEQEQKQFEADQALKRDQLAEEKRQFNATHSGGSGNITGGSSGGSKKKPTSNTKKGVDRIASANPQVKKTNKNSSNSVSVDMNSVLSLGFGPISASRLNELVKQGIVEEYQSGNKLKYRKSASTNKQQMLFK